MSRFFCCWHYHFLQCRTVIKDTIFLKSLSPKWSILRNLNPAHIQGNQCGIRRDKKSSVIPQCHREQIERIAIPFSSQRNRHGLLQARRDIRSVHYEVRHLLRFRVVEIQFAPILIGREQLISFIFQRERHGLQVINPHKESFAHLGNLCPGKSRPINVFQSGTISKSILSHGENLRQYYRGQRLT